MKYSVKYIENIFLNDKHSNASYVGHPLFLILPIWVLFKSTGARPGEDTLQMYLDRLHCNVLWYSYIPRYMIYEYI